MSGSQTTTVRKFLDTAFWGVGVFCCYWETQVFAAAHRFGEVELAVLGRCSGMEAVILTLSLAWLPLLILHLIVHQYQRLSAARPRFPGAIGGSDIPSGLKWLRFLLFVVLCLWPSFVHVFITVVRSPTALSFPRGSLLRFSTASDGRQSEARS